MRSQHILRLAAAFAIVVIGSCGCSGRLAVSRPRSVPAEQTRGPRLVRVVLCGRSLEYGCEIVQLDLATRRMTTYRENRRLRTWTGEVRLIPPKGVRSLRDEARGAGVRTFNPRCDWFVGGSVPDIAPEIITLVWSDREAAYAVPPPHLRRTLPKEAQPIYLSVDAICGAIHHYDESVQPISVETGLSDKSPAVVAAVAKCDASNAASLPRGREW